MESDIYPKISVITVCYNAAATIEQTIQSVLHQDYSNFEYLVIDGGSVDESTAIIDRYADRIDYSISEKDKGMYDAINKGIKASSGDIIGILNADDCFASASILTTIARTFKESQADAVFGDICFIDKKGKTIRYASSKSWSPSWFAWGYMPPHPSFYCKRTCFHEFGYYRTDFDIAADFELLLRFLKIHKLTYKRLPLLMVKMKLGGKSTKSWRSTLVINQEIMRACRINNVKTNYPLLYSRYLNKVWELVFRNLL